MKLSLKITGVVALIFALPMSTAGADGAAKQCSSFTEMRAKVEKICIQSASRNSPACASQIERMKALDERAKRAGCQVPASYQYGTTGEGLSTNGSCVQARRPHESGVIMINGQKSANESFEAALGALIQTYPKSAGYMNEPFLSDGEYADFLVSKAIQQRSYYKKGEPGELIARDVEYYLRNFMGQRRIFFFDDCKNHCINSPKVLDRLKFENWTKENFQELTLDKVIDVGFDGLANLAQSPEGTMIYEDIKRLAFYLDEEHDLDFLKDTLQTDPDKEMTAPGGIKAANRGANDAAKGSTLTAIGQELMPCIVRSTKPH